MDMQSKRGKALSVVTAATLAVSLGVPAIAVADEADQAQQGVAYERANAVDEMLLADQAQQSDTDVEELPDGSTVTTVTNPDGSQTVTTEARNGVSTVVSKDAEGNVTAVEASIPADVAAAGTVALPMSPLEPALSVLAPVISLDCPEGTVVNVPVAGPAGQGGPSAGAVLAVLNSDGTEDVLHKTARTPSGLTAELPAGAAIKVLDVSASFPDTAGTWYGTEGVADFVNARGILKGMPQDDGSLLFDGDEVVNRAMFVTMLHRAESESPAPGAGFADAKGTWYEAAAAWGDEAGVIEGYGESKVFGGEDSVTREQMALFLKRYAEHLGLNTSARADLSEFPDAAEVSVWAEDAMSWAVAWGLLSGREGQLDPSEGATRAEACAVVMRFINGMYA